MPSTRRFLESSILNLVRLDRLPMYMVLPFVTLILDATVIVATAECSILSRTTPGCVAIHFDSHELGKCQSERSLSVFTDR